MTTLYIVGILELQFLMRLQIQSSLLGTEACNFVAYLRLATNKVIRIYHTCQVGVVYLKEFQSNEEEIFSNQPDSPRFEDFLRLLGKR